MLITKQIEKWSIDTTNEAKINYNELVNERNFEIKITNSHEYQKSEIDKYINIIECLTKISTMWIQLLDMKPE